MTGILDGKVAVVTGAAGTIGSATCLLMAARGAQIVAVDRPGADFSELRKTIDPGKFLSVEADIAEADEVQAYVDRALAFGSRIDILFNNAGIVGPVSPLTDCAIEDFRNVMRINVEGMFLGLKYVLPHMIEQRCGSVINTASIAGSAAMPGVTAYTTSKHAVLGLTRSAAVEVAQYGVRVNCINPGPIEGPLISSVDGARAADQLKREQIIPSRRYGRPAEVARLVAFLACDDAAYINGSVHCVDGGLNALRAT